MNETIFTVISNQGVDFITRFHLSKGLGIFYNWGLAASNCSFLASIGEMVIAGNIIPLAVLVPNDYDTIFSSRKKAVWLVGPPVLILQGAAISPTEVMLKHLVIEAYPLIVMAHTIHKHLFFMRQDACEMGALQPAFSLSCIPRAAVGKVLVALPLEFVPAVVTCLGVLLTKCTNVARKAEAPERIETVNARGSIATGVRVTFIKIKLTLVAAVSWHTGAHVGSFSRITGASVKARVRFATIWS